MVSSRIPGGLTLNIIRRVYIDETPLGFPKDFRELVLAGTIAHEASHVEQAFLSSSLEQEAKAYITAAKVLSELGYEDKEGWAILKLEDAIDKVLKLYPDHPLYSQIPRYQKMGLEDVIEMIRQGIILLQSALDGSGRG